MWKKERLKSRLNIPQEKNMTFKKIKSTLKKEIKKIRLQKLMKL